MADQVVTFKFDRQYVNIRKIKYLLWIYFTNGVCVCVCVPNFIPWLIFLRDSQNSQWGSQNGPGDSQNKWIRLRLLRMTSSSSLLSPSSSSELQSQTFKSLFQRRCFFKHRQKHRGWCFFKTSLKHRIVKQKVRCFPQCFRFQKGHSELELNKQVRASQS